MNEKSEYGLNEINKGDKVTLCGKTFELLGIGTNGKEAFFKNVRSRKYPSYARIINGKIDLLGMTRMRCTINQLVQAHGF